MESYCYTTIKIRKSDITKNEHKQILLYNKGQDYYYLTTFDNIFYSLKVELNEFETKESKEIEDLKSEFNAYKENMNQKFNELLRQYKESSKKLIEMVEKNSGGE